MGKKLQIVKSPWYTAEKESPTVSMQEFALKAAAVPAERDDRPTVALLAAYRLPGRFGLMYGSRIAGVVRIVAVNPQTGLIYFNHAEASHAQPIETAIDPDAKQDPSEPALVAVEGTFNVDLAKHLGLPPEKADYLVFAWIDEITSEPLTVTVPEDKQRPKSRTKPGRAEPPVVTFGRSGQSPPVKDSPIALAWAGPDGFEANMNDVAVYGTASPKLLPDRPPGKDEPSTFLSVLAVGSRSRELRWHSIDLPDGVIESRECCFDFSPGKLVDPTDPPQKAFVLAVLGTTVSGVLVVDPGG